MPEFTPAQAAKWFKARPAVMNRNMLTAERASLRYGLRILKAKSGTQHFSSAMLERMGHPYSKKQPCPPMPPDIINKQSGLFNSSFTVFLSFPQGDFINKIINHAPYAGFLQTGTRRMIARPIDLVTQSLVQVYRIRQAELALKRTFNL